MIEYVGEYVIVTRRGDGQWQRWYPFAVGGDRDAFWEIFDEFQKRGLMETSSLRTEIDILRSELDMLVQEIEHRIKFGDDDELRHLMYAKDIAKQIINDSCGRIH